MSDFMLGDIEENMQTTLFIRVENICQNIHQHHETFFIVTIYNINTEH